MQEISSVKELKDAIRQLESEQKLYAVSLKEQFPLVVESLKPMNLLRYAVSEIVRSPFIQIIGIETIKTIGHRLIDKFLARFEK
jgi:hypothetical protein